MIYIYSSSELDSDDSFTGCLVTFAAYLTGWVTTGCFDYYVFFTGTLKNKKKILLFLNSII